MSHHSSVLVTGTFFILAVSCAFRKKGRGTPAPGVLSHLRLKRGRRWRWDTLVLPLQTLCSRPTHPYQPTQNRTMRPIACRFHDPASQVTLPSSVVLQKRSAKLLSTMHSVQCVFERINGLEFPL